MQILDDDDDDGDDDDDDDGDVVTLMKTFPLVQWKVATSSASQWTSAPQL